MPATNGKLPRMSILTDGGPLYVVSGAQIRSPTCLGQGPIFNLIGHMILRWLPLKKFCLFFSFTEDGHHTHLLGFH